MTNDNYYCSQDGAYVDDFGEFGTFVRNTWLYIIVYANKGGIMDQFNELISDIM